MLLARWARRLFDRRATVLVYHRVAELDVDPWGLAVSPARFRAQIELLSRRSPVLALPDAIARVDNGTLPRGAVVVTFDDGYADTLHVAAPILERYGVAATVFITTGSVGGDHEFWWDELESLLLSGRPLPPTLVVDIDSESYSWTLDDDRGDPAESAGAASRWRAWDPPPTRRHAAFLEIWRHLRRLSAPARRAVLDRLGAWASHTASPRPSHRPVSHGELLELARSPAITIGAHTVHHSQLAALSADDQTRELVDSRSYLEQVLGRPVTTMAYPFGGREDFTAGTIAIAEDAGFTCACASTSGSLRASADRFRIPRCFVLDVDVARFERMLDRWQRS